MAHDAHLREKAIYLRTKHNMTLDEIIERLRLPRATIYYWIKDIPIPRTKKQMQHQLLGTKAMQAKFAAIREQAYQQGWEEAPELLKDSRFRDFVVLYMAEGYKRNRNVVAFVNSDPLMVKLANYWICKFGKNKFDYKLQYHVDQDPEELKVFWSQVVDIQPEVIKVLRKSNSGKLAGRNFRSIHGLLTVSVNDTIFRAKLQAWMDYIQFQW